MMMALWTIGPWTIVLVGISCVTGIAQGDEPAPSPTVLHGGLLLADASQEPRVTVRWEARDGARSISGVLGYGAPTGGEVLESDTPDDDWDGGNIRAYVALGGTRVDTGAGHPKGVVVRVGLTKVDSNREFFERIVPGSMIEIEISGVVLSEAIKYHEGTGLMHLKFAIGDLEACSLPGTARNQYLMSDPSDTLSGRVVSGVNASPGALGGGFGVEEDSEHGSFEVDVDEEDPARMRFVVRVPYGLLRHLQDPWDSVLPGTFFEPIHLHAEAELIPVGADPLVREPWVPEVNPGQDDDQADDE